MCLLYVSFGSNVRPITLGCVAIGSALGGGKSDVYRFYFYILCRLCVP